MLSASLLSAVSSTPNDGRDVDRELSLELVALVLHSVDAEDVCGDHFVAVYVRAAHRELLFCLLNALDLSKLVLLFAVFAGLSAVAVEDRFECIVFCIGD